MHDDELRRFEAEGARISLDAEAEGYVEHEGARLWYASYGTGAPVVLLHGGLGHSGNWGYQVGALVGAGYRAIVVDSRGHGRSTRDARPYSYELMASDVFAVMDALGVARAVLVGWSDGGCAALIAAHRQPERVPGVFFFACNMDPSGTKVFEPGPVVDRCFSRHRTDYAALSATPENFKKFVEDVGLMQRTQPDYSAAELGEIGVPVAIVLGEGDEFIRREHAEYLARSVAGAELMILPGVSHFAPLQRPEVFDAEVLGFLGRLGYSI